jgi:hypothetical protein
MKTLTRLALVPGALLFAANAASAGVTIHVPKDFPTIQEAIDAAVETDVIMISNGQYRENLVLATPGVTLKATGKNVVVDGAYAGSCLEVTADDVSLMGIAFVNGGVPGGGTTTTEGTETGTGGVLLTGAGALVTKCEFRANVDFGLKLVGTGEVTDNLMVATLGPGLVLDSGDAAGPLTSVKSNEIVRNASGVQALKGPFVFDKNTISNNMGDGLSVSILTADGAGPGSDPTTITKNKLFGNGTIALLLVDELGSTTLIDKNNIDENGTGMDLTADGLTVSNNDIDQSNVVGAWLRVSNMTWDGNKMRRSTVAGAVISTAPGVTDGNNTFKDSHFQTSGGDGAIVQSSLNVFDDCLFSDNQGDGFSITGGVAGNQVLDSLSRDNGHDGFDNSGTDTLFTDNKSKDNLGADLAGIGDGTGTVDAASTGNTVSDESGLEAEQELELDTLATLP